MPAGMLVAAIRLYRWLARRIPWSRNCLYGISCSRHVERVAREAGLRAAVRAMRARWAACRPGYSFEYSDKSWRLRCADGSVIPPADASPVVHQEAAMCRLLLPAA